MEAGNWIRCGCAALIRGSTGAVHGCACGSTA